MRRPDYLFLDEPTNHLDMDMLEWLEGYLLSYGGGILIVSHDRYFLDRVATGILELSHGKVTKYKGNYTRYVEQHDQQQKASNGPIRNSRNIFMRRKNIFVNTRPASSKTGPGPPVSARSIGTDRMAAR